MYAAVGFWIFGLFSDYDYYSVAMNKGIQIYFQNRNYSKQMDYIHEIVYSSNTQYTHMELKPDSFVLFWATPDKA